jgi:hypothetical protein
MTIYIHIAGMVWDLHGLRLRVRANVKGLKVMRGYATTQEQLDFRVGAVQDLRRVAEFFSLLRASSYVIQQAQLISLA